jgi:hypothetical protein
MPGEYALLASGNPATRAVSEGLPAATVLDSAASPRLNLTASAAAIGRRGRHRWGKNCHGHVEQVAVPPDSCDSTIRARLKAPFPIFSSSGPSFTRQLAPSSSRMTSSSWLAEIPVRGTFTVCIVSLSWETALHVMFDGVAPELLVPPVNVRRLALHPQGLAPRVVNFAEWGRHVTEMIHHQIDRRPDPGEAALLSELDGYVGDGPPEPGSDYMGLAMPLHLTSSAGNLKLLTTVTSFATAVDVTIAELRLEAFLPADAETATRLESLRASRRSSPPVALPGLVQ